ncbi:MAG: hypothetical protein ACLVAW_21395 [Eisenbergiella massiliensis]
MKIWLMGALAAWSRSHRGKGQEAAAAAGIDGFIRRLPQGYDTILTDEWTNISKGQKQLLTIARAMLLPPGCYIDEATSCGYPY